MARNFEKLELTLAIPFNDTLGFMCPNCKSVGIGERWKIKAHYCPECGQHIKLMPLKDWEELLKDVQKIPKVLESKIVTTELDMSEGFNKAKMSINGVYLERFRDYFKDNAQIEGQMSIFDLGKGATGE